MNSTVRQRLVRARTLLLRWHRKQNKREFSWRHDVRDPYEVLVCEMMGQQTQASRIEIFLKKFLRKFPTVSALANAKQSDVIRAWQGLGYNRRALHLHNAAKMIAVKHGGIIPRSQTDLLVLPGIGAYTASAIRVFAFEENSSAVDVNVSRVITRLSKKVRDRTELLPLMTVQEINEEIMPRKAIRDWHEAIMDFGATICTKNNPQCDICPLRNVCLSKGLYKKIHSSLDKKQQKEKQYFGAPKRIWRGRILKIITDGRRIGASDLKKSLHQQFGLTASEVSAILSMTLPELLQEGFIRHSTNDSYSLK
ncbi:MAG TPA: hypothetical protein VEW28_00515 [Candidatus Kapabacteria bacterium]|nr:hypothetical protein [Candidatus Kapabacteria bacterium]